MTRWQRQPALACIALALAVTLVTCQPSAGAPQLTPAVRPSDAPALATPTPRYPPFNSTPTPPLRVEAPAWARDAVAYELCVASFYDSNGDGVGDLPGLIQRLDYLNDGNPATTDDLGVDVLCLLPIFTASSQAGFDTLDHFTIRPAYGTRQDLTRLAEECHRRGMHLVLDYVMSYVSEQQPFFQHAFKNLYSVYGDWFVWRDAPHTRHKGFDDNPALPALNGEAQGVQEYALRLARYWMDPDADGDYTDGVDGYRCVDAQGLPHAFWGRLRAQSKALRPDFWLLGDVRGDATQIAGYLQGQFDAALDGPLYAAWAGDGDGVDAPGRIDAALRQSATLYPWGAGSVGFLNRHDTPRVISAVQGARLAATLLLTLPGTPLLYYGEELGMAGGPRAGQPNAENYALEPLDWYAGETGAGMTTWFRPADRNNRPHDGVSVEEQTADAGSLLSHYRRLIRLRQTYAALRRGGYERVSAGSGAPQVLAYLRQDADSHLLVVLNLSREPAPAMLDLGASSLPAGPWTVTDLLANQPLPPSSASTYTLNLPPQSGFVLLLKRP